MERLALAAGLGLGVIGMAMLAIGAVGGLYLGIVGPLVGLGLVWATSRTMPLVRAVGQTVRSELFDCQRGDMLSRFMLIFTVVLLLLSLVKALTPPTSWDSLAYHLTGPKLWVEGHRIWPALEMPFGGYPSLMEMLFTVGLLA